jgi:hypothetical protein
VGVLVLKNLVLLPPQPLNLLHRPPPQPSASSRPLKKRLLLRRLSGSNLR